MPLRPGIAVRERIALIGGQGAGKTSAWLQIARLAKSTGSPAQFYVFDTDYAVERMLATEYADVADIVHYREVDTWEEFTSLGEQYVNKATSDDFIVVDFLYPAWDAVQAWYIEQVFKRDPAEFWLAMRAQAVETGKEAGALEGWKDWPRITKTYTTWLASLVKSRANLIATTPADPIATNEKSKELKMIFGPYGVKPKGQKGTGHTFHTVLWLSQFGPNEWRVTTIKDRGRERLEGAIVKNFAIDYLVKVAGWRLDDA